MWQVAAAVLGAQNANMREMSQSVGGLDLPADNFWSPLWWRRARRVFCPCRQQKQKLRDITMRCIQKVSRPQVEEWARW